MSREIVLDTETTGLDPEEGHRIVEIGCVELINKIKTGKTFHTFINPARYMPRSAEQIHGLTDVFLKDKPFFKDIVDKFLSFIADDKLVIHNAAFDMKFVNHELNLLKLANIKSTRAIDTLTIAKKRFPGARVSLDSLCNRFDISIKKREKHSALLDAELLTEVYQRLTGETQSTISFSEGFGLGVLKANTKEKAYQVARPFSTTPEEDANHENFLKKIKQPMWSN